MISYMLICIKQDNKFPLGVYRSNWNAVVLQKNFAPLAVLSDSNSGCGSVTFVQGFISFLKGFYCKFLGYRYIVLSFKKGGFGSIGSDRSAGICWNKSDLSGYATLIAILY